MKDTCYLFLPNASIRHNFGPILSSIVRSKKKTKSLDHLCNKHPKSYPPPEKHTAILPKLGCNPYFFSVKKKKEKRIGKRE